MIRVWVAALRHLSPARLGSSLLHAFGALWLVVEVSAFFSTPVATTVRGLWWLFLLIGFIVGLLRAWPRLSVHAVVPGTDCRIAIEVTDLFRVRDAAYIVSTNTTFDTAIEDRTISPESVQGQLTAKFFPVVDQLDREISYSLNGISGSQLTPEEKPFGKRLRFAPGTVASVMAGSTRVYLVAMATMNVHRVAQASRQDLTDSLPRLWEYIRTRGGLEWLCCPILGSGFSRAAATREELVLEIIRSFIPAVRAGVFCRGLTIAVNPADYRLGRINLQRLEAFLQHECTYGSAVLTSGTASVGTPQGV